ncbi:MAG: hypothetical protein Q8O09_01245 [Bacillota bacterium]|nr:hypothetical protein [Bacillota bacterium]
MGKSNDNNIIDFELKDLCVKKIEFKKLKEPSKGTELGADFKCQYQWTQEDAKNGEIIATVSFQFSPKVLFSGKLIFKIGVSINDKNCDLEENERQSIFDTIEQQLASMASFVTTVCGEAICGSKFIIPPLFSEKKEICV